MAWRWALTDTREGQGQSWAFRIWTWLSVGEVKDWEPQPAPQEGGTEGWKEAGPGVDRKEAEAGLLAGKGPGRGRNHFSFPF